MMSKGLSHYSKVQKSVKEYENRAHLEKIVERAGLYNIAFLENKALLETILDAPNQEIDATTVQTMQKLLLWLEQTQEEAKLS